MDGVSKHQQKLHKDTVEALNNDYVRSNVESKHKKRKEIIYRRRRTALYLIVAGVIVFGLIDLWIYQKDRLAEKQAEKEALAVELKQIKEHQEMLKLQITKLEDDEYIAKLARKEYFLSDEGEIIFAIPSDKGE